MKLHRLLSLTSVALATTACGKVGDLEPRSGNSAPPQAYGQTREQTAANLTTPSVQARPGRIDELVKRSERRADDPFDIAPGEEPTPLNPDKPSQNAPANPE